MIISNQSERKTIICVWGTVFIIAVFSLGGSITSTMYGNISNEVSIIWIIASVILLLTSIGFMIYNCIQYKYDLPDISNRLQEDMGLLWIYKIVELLWMPGK